MYFLASSCKFGNKCYFRHVEADEKPSKKIKKGGAKRSVALLKESKVVHLKILIRENLFYVNLPKEKNGKKRSIARNYAKNVNLMSAVLARPGLRRGHKRKPCTKKDARAE